jgi:hypothetical protein
MDPHQQKYTVMPLPVVTVPDYGCGEWESIIEVPPEGSDDEKVKAALEKMP